MDESAAPVLRLKGWHEEARQHAAGILDPTARAAALLAIARSEARLLVGIGMPAPLGLMDDAIAIVSGSSDWPQAVGLCQIAHAQIKLTSPSEAAQTLRVLCDLWSRAAPHPDPLGLYVSGTAVWLATRSNDRELAHGLAEILIRISKGADPAARLESLADHGRLLVEVGIWDTRTLLAQFMECVRDPSIRLSPDTFSCLYSLHRVATRLHGAGEREAFSEVLDLMASLIDDREGEQSAPHLMRRATLFCDPRNPGDAAQAAGLIERALTRVRRLASQDPVAGADVLVASLEQCGYSLDAASFNASRELMAELLENLEREHARQTPMNPDTIAAIVRVSHHAGRRDRVHQLLELWVRAGAPDPDLVGYAARIPPLSAGGLGSAPTGHPSEPVQPSDRRPYVDVEIERLALLPVAAQADSAAASMVEAALLSAWDYFDEVIGEQYLPEPPILAAPWF